MVFLSLGNLWADESRVIPSVGVRQDYNDNVFFDTHNREKDFITTIWGGLEVQRKTERMDFSLLGRGDQRYYSHNTGLNSFDQLYRTSLAYKLTPKLTASVRGLYQIDSQPDRDLELSGLALSPSKRHRQSYGTAAEYTLTEKSLVSVSYGYDKDDYNKSDETDIRSHSAGLSLIRDLSGTVEAAKGIISLGFSCYAFDDSRVDNSTIMVGLEKQMSEKWSFSMSGGVRHTRSRIRVLEPVPFVGYVERTTKDTSLGGVGRGSLSYRGERTYSELGASHELTPASGRSGTAVRTSVFFSGRRRFTYELWGTLTAEYFRNRSTQGDLSTEPINEETFRVSPGFRYDFNQKVSLDGSYGYTKVKNKEDDSTTRRNLFTLRLSVKHALFE